MTTTTTDLSDMTLINIDVSMWTGRARLSLEDLPVDVRDQLPPEELASLGSKKLVDPDLLRPIVQVKTKMFTFMGIHGVKFLGGYAVPDAALPDVTQELSELSQEFTDRVNTFAGDYAQATEEWMAKHPAWREALSRALPDFNTMRGKFSFTFQCLKVHVADTGLAGDNGTLTAQSVGSKALQEICHEIAELRDSSFPDGREKFTVRAFRGFAQVIEKCKATTFFNPEIAPLQALLEDIRTTFQSVMDDRRQMGAMSLILDSLSDPAKVAAVCETYRQMPLTAMPTELCPVTQPEPEPTPEPQPEPTPEPQPMSSLTSMFASMDTALL